jgi:hypothetical protein
LSRPLLKWEGTHGGDAASSRASLRHNTFDRMMENGGPGEIRMHDPLPSEGQAHGLQPLDSAGILPL